MIRSTSPATSATAAATRSATSHLSRMGHLSTRAIAPVLGVSNKTVHQDVHAAREVLPEVTPTEPVTGLDGKTYTRPEPYPGPMRAEHREHLRELLRRTHAATKPAELRAIYREASDARLLAYEVDADGTTLEHVLWNRRTDTECPRSA